MNFDGKTALITGASGGIGAACAERLADAGAHVLLHYNTAKDRAQVLRDTIAARGGLATIVQADLALPDGPSVLTDATGRSVDGLDILVNCAGINRPTALGGTTPGDLDALFAVNARAPFLLVQALSPMLRDRGRIVLVTSATVGKVRGDFSAYSASKAAVTSMVPYFATALGKRGIGVNALAPGTTRTPITERFLANEQGMAAVLTNQAFDRVAEPDDIARAICWLASSDAEWMTGTVLHVDGGFKL